MSTAEAREQFFRNSFKKRGTLKADEQDIHTIRTPDHEPMLSKHDVYNHGTNDVRLSDIGGGGYRFDRFDHSHNNNIRVGRGSLQPELLHQQRNIKPAVSKLKSQVSPFKTNF